MSGGHWLSERVPGGARWAYVFGSALVFLLVAQLASGLALAMSYSASVPAAWAPVARIEQSGLGHLIRGLHAQGATFLLAILLAFCLSGSPLPWDERGDWATRVTVGIAGSLPLAGPSLERMLSGGHPFGTLTLTRCSSSPIPEEQSCGVRPIRRAPSIRARSGTSGRSSRS